MSFQKDETWDGYMRKKLFSDEEGNYFKDGPKWATYYHGRLLGYFDSERDSETAFFKAKGIPDPRNRRRY